MGDGSTPGVIDASNVTFDGSPASGLSTTSAPLTAYQVEDQITDYLDDPALGYVSLQPTNVYVAQASESPNPGAIQRGVNVAPINGTVNVQAGTYAGGIQIDNPLKLLGANTGVDPNTADPNTPATRGTESEIQVGGADAPNAITITDTENVTIDGLLIDGNNSLSEGIVLTDATDVVVSNNIIQNFQWLGIDAEGSSAFSSVDVEQNRVLNIPGQTGVGYGDGIYFGSNGYGTASDNVVLGARRGIMVDTNGDIPSAERDDFDQLRECDTGWHLGEQQLWHSRRGVGRE